MSDGNVDWVASMEARRRVREGEKKKEREEKEKRKAEAAKLTKEYAEEQRRIAQGKITSTQAIVVRRFEMPDVTVTSGSAVTSDAEEWWNSTLNKKKVRPFRREKFPPVDAVKDRFDLVR